MKILMQASCRKHNCLWFLHSRERFHPVIALKAMRANARLSAASAFTRRVNA